ncbi:MAG: ATP synthase subunit alpha [Parcubacteria group bacterium GW2011_GWA2_38_13]|nr:MAG: ATP synthase subunit alpha [Parcubacteria group bacterium GW2011_GWA2_38_13]
MNKDQIIENLKQQITRYQSEVKTESVGKVIEVGDGIARVSGLQDAMMSEMLDFGKGIFGVVLNLEEESIGVIVLGEYQHLKEGDLVKKTGRILEVPVGDALVGRVVNPLGEPIDGKGPIKTQNFYPIEKIAPRVITRQSVNKPVQTGITSIDAMIPIGRGQRELIIGDRQTGKTAIAIDTIINQKGQDMICIYVAIGQKKSKVRRLVAELESRGAMQYSTVVVASASDPAPLIYLSPFAGCSMGEYFMDKGKDVLCIYDDLSKHAVSYREISLLLRRPPGREAYPGDIFYLHSRLLERAARLNENYGNGSLTALPIIETQAGDISAYIPTNVISITDGQIFLESDLFYQGIRPAINTGLSVSRVGSAAQIKAMKQVAGKIKLEMAQYRELASFAQFGSDLDEATQKQIRRGQKLTEILKQGQYEVASVFDQVVVLFSAINGFVDDIPNEKVKQFQKSLIEYMNTNAKKVMESLKEKKEITKEIEEELKKVIGEFKKSFL